MISLADKILKRTQAAGLVAGQPAEPLTPSSSVSLVLSPPIAGVEVVASPDSGAQVDPDARILRVKDIEEGVQARKTFTHLEDLATSIAQQGQLQSIIVTEIAPGRYQVAYGARRLRAIRDHLKRETILARIARNLLDANTLRLAQLAENIQRVQYEPLELAAEFASLMNDNQWTQAELAERVGVKQGWVSKKLSLLSAPAAVQTLIANGELAETDYYNNKDGVLAGVAGDGASPARAKTVAVPLQDVVEIAKLFRELATLHQLNEIELGAVPKKKELLAIMSRVKDIKRAVGKH